MPPLANQQIVLAERGKGVEINPHTVDLTVKEQPPALKKAKLQETIMEEAIKLSYPEGTFICHNADHYAELLYQSLTPSDDAELKNIHMDYFY